MVRSVEEILQKEFGRSLSDKGVHILDPFVGTGNFIIRIMQEIKTTASPTNTKTSCTAMKSCCSPITSPA